MADRSPLPQPTEQDEVLAMEFIRVKDDTALRGSPEGDERCDNCHFYADPTEEISYCWHDKLEVLAGRDWWCDRWEAIGASTEQMTADHAAASKDLQRTVVEDNLLAADPKYDQQCDECMFYLNPDDSVSYCWHPRVRIGVGARWWCQWWEEGPQA